MSAPYCRRTMQLTTAREIQYCQNSGEEARREGGEGGYYVIDSLAQTKQAYQYIRVSPHLHLMPLFAEKAT